jgi:hypothetical protein
MNKWLVVVVLVMLVLAGAMGLRNLASAGHAASVVVANGAGPVPPTPWMNGAGPVPPTPWMNGAGPVPPTPWNR